MPAAGTRKAMGTQAQFPSDVDLPLPAQCRSAPLNIGPGAPIVLDVGASIGTLTLKYSSGGTEKSCSQTGDFICSYNDKNPLKKFNKLNDLTPQAKEVSPLSGVYGLRIS